MLRRYRFGNPWRELDRLQREMNRVFENTLSGYESRVAPQYPALNVWTNEEGAAITAELPGVKAEDIDISVLGETLTLKGVRRPEARGETDRYHRRERRHGSFSRTVELPFQVEANKVDATFDRGVLHISLPRAEADKPRKISVKAA